MFQCCHCKDHVISSENNEFSYYTKDNMTQTVCHSCFFEINSKLKIQLDSSKLRLLKKRITRKKNFNSPFC